MNRREFMDRLEALLQSISPEERNEAMQYYNDYFDDAGPENEGRVIRELESPEKVAAIIRTGLSSAEDGNEFHSEHSEYRETGYTDTRFEEYEVPITRETGGNYGGNRDSQGRRPWTSRPLKIFLIIMIICVGVPTVIPAVGGIFLGILGVLAAIFGVAVAILFAGIAIMIGGVVCFATGLVQLFHFAPVGVLLIGIGLLLVALGAVLTAAIWWLCIIKVFPSIFRWFVELCRKPFQKRR